MENFKTTRKNFIKASALIGIGSLTLGAKASSFLSEPNLNAALLLPQTDGKFTLPALPYAYNALEPFIDAQTMEIHHTKHHQAYIKKLNEAIALESTLQGKSLEDLLLGLSAVPEKVRSMVRNHGGGHWNHSFFWKSMKLGTQMGTKFSTLATSSFGSIDQFKANFEKVSMGVFGSGWAWVVLQDKQIKIMTSANQDNPLMDVNKDSKRVPTILFGIDLWEHAYYLKHKNKRADYVSNFWNVVNWDEIELLLK